MHWLCSLHYIAHCCLALPINFNCARIVFMYCVHPRNYRSRGFEELAKVFRSSDEFCFSQIIIPIMTDFAPSTPSSNYTLTISRLRHLPTNRTSPFSHLPFVSQATSIFRQMPSTPFNKTRNHSQPITNHQTQRCSTHGLNTEYEIYNIKTMYSTYALAFYNHCKYRQLHTCILYMYIYTHAYIYTYIHTFICV